MPSAYFPPNAELCHTTAAGASRLMRVYNNLIGLVPADDWLPDRFFDDPIDSGQKQGVKLDRKAFRDAVQTYYEMMGWDEDGVLRPATLYDHHLEWVLAQLHY